MKKTIRPMVVGQTPPPYHGTNVMTAVFLEGLDELEYPYFHHEKKFSLHMEEVEAISAVKILRFFKIYVGFIRALKKNRPTLVIYFISTKPFSIIPDSLILLIPYFMKLPFVLRFGAIGHRKNNRKIYLRWIYKLILKKSCGSIIPGSAPALEEDVAFINKRIYVLDNCLSKKDHEQLYLSNANRKSNGPCRVLFLSNLIEKKGVFTVIQAVPGVLEKKPNTEFIFVGRFFNEEFAKRVHAYIEKENIGHAVKFSGPKIDNEKAAEYKKADIFVFPSEIDIFGVVNIEAMAAGLPVIASDVNEMPWIIDDGITGYIIPPKDPQKLAEKIVNLVSEEKLRKKMGRKGREKYLRQYSFEAYIRKMDRILTEIADSLR